MQAEIIQAVEQCARASNAGELSFPDLMARLAQAGITSYFADYRRADTTFYGAGTCSVPLPRQDAPIATRFDALLLQGVIRGAQAGQVRYPEFLQRSRAAGCIGYIVWIAGRHVSYYGPMGEVHVEHFPD